MKENFNKIERGGDRISADQVIEMLKNLEVDPEDVEELGKLRAREKAQKKILCDPNLDSETLDELAYKVRDWDSTGYVEADIIRNPNVSEKTILEIAKEPNLVQRTQVAIVENGNPKATPEIIALVARRADDMIVLSDIGRHPNTPIEVIKDLLTRKYGGTDGSAQVRLGIAENPNLTPKLLKKIARNKFWFVRSVVAERADVPPRIRANLAKDNRWFVRVRVAESEQSPEVLTKMANDEDEYVRSAVLGNPNTPPEIKENLEKNENPGKLKKEVKMLLESFLEYSKIYEMTGTFYNAAVTLTPLIDDSVHYGRTPPIDTSKSFTATVKIADEMVENNPHYLSEPNSRGRMNAIKAILGIGPVPDLSELE